MDAVNRVQPNRDGRRASWLGALLATTALAVATWTPAAADNCGTGTDTGASSLACGTLSVASGIDSTAVGQQASASGDSSTAVGFNSSLIHISEPTRRTPISYPVFCL